MASHRQSLAVGVPLHYPLQAHPLSWPLLVPLGNRLLEKIERRMSLATQSMATAVSDLKLLPLHPPQNPPAPHKPHLPTRLCGPPAPRSAPWHQTDPRAVLVRATAHCSPSHCSPPPRSQAPTTTPRRGRGLRGCWPSEVSLAGPTQPGPRAPPCRSGTLGGACKCSLWRPRPPCRSGTPVSLPRPRP